MGALVLRLLADLKIRHYRKAAKMGVAALRCSSIASHVIHDIDSCRITVYKTCSNLPLA